MTAAKTDIENEPTTYPEEIDEVVAGTKKRRARDDDDDEGETEFDASDCADEAEAEPMQTEDNAARAARPVSPEGEPAVSASANPPLSSSEAAFSPELLRAYYSRLFPFGMLVDWLSYDPSTSNASNDARAPGNPAAPKTTDRWGASSSDSVLSRREFSFTIEPSPGDEIYVRYQSFSSSFDLAAAVRRRNPVKIDIGAVFNHPPRNKAALGGSADFKPDQRELVFDIDLTDYDEVRKCGCQGAKICPRCWTAMSMAVRVMDEGLRSDFGFRHIAWFYSGRRGVHAWVCDRNARELTDEGRSAVAGYFELKMGTDKNRKFFLPHPLHPMLKRSYAALEPMFVEHVLPETGHGLLASEGEWNKVLKSLPEGAEPVAKRLERRWNSKGAEGDTTPSEKWDELKNNLSILTGKNRSNGGKASKNLSASERIKIEQFPVRIVFQHSYPRLDVNVSKMRNHLLKSPFCVHPKTGRVCVPIDAKRVEEFDPFEVPTLPRLMREIDEYERSHGEDVDNTVKHEWQKTSLRGPFEAFRKRFLTPLINDIRREKKAEAEGRAAATGDF